MKREIDWEEARNMFEQYRDAYPYQRRALLESWESLSLLALAELIGHYVYECRGSQTIKAWACRLAFAKAKTLADWVLLVNTIHSDSHQHKRACEKILQFDVRSDVDIALLGRASSMRLRNIAWYLTGRKKAKRKR
jgi:hypothetical protein